MKFEVQFQTESCHGSPWTESFDESYVNDMFEANEYMVKWLDNFNMLVDNESCRRILIISTKALV